MLFRDKRALLLLFLMPALLVLTLTSILNHLYQNQKPTLRVLLYSPQQSNVGQTIGRALKSTQESVTHANQIPKSAHKDFDVLIKIPTKLP